MLRVWSSVQQNLATCVGIRSRDELTAANHHQACPGLGEAEHHKAYLHTNRTAIIVIMYAKHTIMYVLNQYVWPKEK